MQPASFNQPLDLQVHACVDERVEIPVRVFEGERIGVRQVARDEEV